jgi:hypothetical protein
VTEISIWCNCGRQAAPALCPRRTQLLLSEIEALHHLVSGGVGLN